MVLAAALLGAPPGSAPSAEAISVSILGKGNCSNPPQFKTCHTVWQSGGVEQTGFPICCGIGKTMNLVVFDQTDYPSWNNEIVSGANQWGDEYKTPIDIAFNVTANRPESWIIIYSDASIDQAGKTYFCQVDGSCNQNTTDPQNIHYAVIRINPNYVYAAQGSASSFLKALVTHELGHAFGLVPHASGGKSQGHLCSTVSVMQPPNYAIDQSNGDTWINDPRADDIGIASCPGEGFVGASGVACIYRSHGYGGPRDCSAY